MAETRSARRAGDRQPQGCRDRDRVAGRGGHPAEIDRADSSTTSDPLTGLTEASEEEFEVRVVDAAKVDDARKLVRQRRSHRPVARDPRPASNRTGTVTAVCEECGKSSEWPATAWAPPRPARTAPRTWTSPTRTMTGPRWTSASRRKPTKTRRSRRTRASDGNGTSPLHRCAAGGGTHARQGAAVAAGRAVVDRRSASSSRRGA